jgi:hypothetical protein
MIRFVYPDEPLCAYCAQSISIDEDGQRIDKTYMRIRFVCSLRSKRMLFSARKKMTQTNSDYSDLFSRHLQKCTKFSNDELRAICPFHDDENPSFTANKISGLWRCFGCGAQGNVAQFAERVGGKIDTENEHQRERRIVTTYPYRDEHGTLLYEVVRFDPKDFQQRKPDGNGGWTWKLNGVRRVLYKLPEILDQPTVYLVEGEKDCDRLWSIGLPATTCPQGAGKWLPEYNQSLASKKVVILPDNDEVGEQHAQQIGRSLLPLAEAIKIARLPELPEKGDVSDWLDQGHTKEELGAIVKATPILKAEDLRIEQKPESNELALTKLSDLLNEPEEQVDWLVDKMLPAGGFSLLVAKPKAGKSTLARNLAFAIAQGREFFNKATQRGTVIYLALEEKRSEVRKHFQEMGATGEEEIYVYAASAPVDALQKIRAVAEEKKSALIIIDPLFKLTRVKDSNDYMQVIVALEPLLTLARETGAHVLAVHHAGKGERGEVGDNILGSTAIFAAVDTALIMKRSERYRTISSQQRYGEDLPETVLRFDPATKTVSLGESKEQEEEKRIGDAIVEFLHAKQAPAEEREIHAEVEGRKAVKVRALRRLLEEEKVCRQKKFPDKEGTRGNPFLCALSQCWFASSQDIYGNQGTSNGKADLSPQEDLPFAGSRSVTSSQDSTESQEPAFDTWEDLDQ